MKIRFLASMMLAIVGWQTASAVEVSWYRQPGSARNISSNAAASPWMIGTDGNVYKWDGNSKQFVNQNHNYPATAIAVTTTDKFWLVDQIGLRVAEALNGYAIYLPMKARDVAVGGDNSAWIIGTDVRAGGYGVYQNTSSNSFTQANFGAVDIAVDKTGNAWVVNDTGEIHRYSLASKTWERMPAPTQTGVKARSIHTGGSSGAVWMLTTQSVPGGFPIYQWNASTRSWEPYGTFGAVDITEAAGVPWIVQSDGKLYSKAELTTPSAPVNVTQTWPALIPQQMPPPRVTERGKLLCTSVGSTNDCDEDTKADLVGEYTLDTSCDKGFYDPIYGGSCWECDPGYDGRGAYIRSTTRVDGDTACWRAPVESLGKAILVQAPTGSGCPAGSFWDGYSPNGCCGSCWKCPDTLPRRTGFHINSDSACASSLNETKKATFLSFNGCPKPDAATMKLPGMRTPGKPFLDLAATKGVCWACPITDADGNFLISDRNTNSLSDKDSNTGCAIKMKWQPPTFYEPGLAYMQGVKEVIWEQKLFDGDRITGYLYDVAEGLGLGDATPAAKEWVKFKWQEIATNPYNSDQFRAYVYVLLKEALAKEATKRTAAERQLIKSFAIYIQQRRTYLAEQALAMYDAWKTSDDLFRANTGQSKQWAALFYYGTVPLDFHGILSGLMGLGGMGGGTVNAVVAANAFVQGSIAAEKAAETAEEIGVVFTGRSFNLGAMINDLTIFKSFGLSAVSGATVIQVVGIILSSIAIDQFVAIETARPKLLASLAEAREAVDLNGLASTNGEDTMLLYWSKAMDTWDMEDAQVLPLAAMAQARAEQSGYAAPPKKTIHVGGATASADRLSSGTSNGYLEQNKKLVSSNGKYEAEMQGDGNFVIYAANRQPIWATGTNGKGTTPYKLAMQTDGNLVVYGSSTAIWASGVRAGTAPYKVLMQDDGNLVVYDNSNRAIWASGTNR